MRGEQLTQALLQGAISGSSPHARGTGAAIGGSIGGSRFIPACAGNRVLVRLFLSRRPVHPRMRGEQVRNVAHGGQHYGSSPHARGTGRGFGAFVICLRFIPACAGNSKATMS